jgi:hypothetical protein
MRIEVITTFSESNYQEYAEEHIRTWKEHFDSSINLTFYVDNLDRQYIAHQVLPLEQTVPALTAFKQRHKDFVPKDFRFDAVRFSHKSYAICHAGLHSSADLLIWLDADVIAQRSINPQWLAQKLPAGHLAGYLGRSRFTETGFLIFDRRHSHAEQLFVKWQEQYDQDLMFDGAKSGKTDCHAFDRARVELQAQGVEFHNLNLPEQKHAFHALYPYLVHHKGDSKTAI